jgi:NIMA (never in mitosis gene a)-related kinase
MDFADDEDLYCKIQHYQKHKLWFDEDFCWKVFIQTVRALNALHSMKILHRDLKPANVFLSKKTHARLGDLNVSKVAK